MVPAARGLSSTAASLAASASRHPRAAAGAWILLATALQLARQPGAPAWDTLWAEDAYLFLDDALYDGPAAVLRPIGGYLYVGPRVLAIALAALPIEWAATAFALAAAVIVSCLSVFVFRASAEVLPSPAYRAVLAASMVLLPAAGTESLNNLANLQFFLFFAAMWALPPFRRSSPTTAADLVVVTASALSGGIAPLLVPGALWSLRRSSPRRAAGAAFLGAVALHGALVVVSMLVGAEPDHPWSYPEPLFGLFRVLILVPVYGALVAAPTLVGSRAIFPIWGVLGWGTAVAAVAFVGLLFLAARRARREDLFAAAVAVAISVATFALAFFLRPIWLPAFPPEADFAGNRYTMLPGWLLLTACLILVHALRPSSPAKVLRAAGVAILAVVFLVDFRVANVRSNGPRWSASLAAAARLCEDSPASRLVSIRQPPLGTPYSGAVEIPCSRL